MQTYDEQKVRVDDLIKSNLGQNWNLDRLPKVLLSILRVAVSEMLSKNNVSIGIIISEYVMFTESFLQKKNVHLQMPFWIKNFCKT